jgi:hypothetical protein
LLPARISFIVGQMNFSKEKHKVSETGQTHWLGLSKITLRFISTAFFFFETISTAFRKRSHVDYLFEVHGFHCDTGTPPFQLIFTRFGALGDLSY